ncbi:phospholipase A1-like [Condylostylus longicornis]|uniref:phospholipase A1-like n=1 Tax=Condylostylus longicornis TaxID=2530218 RepID=UPI00244E59C0|nr:phospholipase A1-like [Condylostylus longicornis]
MLFSLALIVLIFSLTGKNASATDDVEFYYYNKLNENGSKIFIGNMESLKEFEANLPIRIIIHGWHGSHNYYPIKILRDAYLKKGNINVIVVNWKQAINIHYLGAHIAGLTGRNLLPNKIDTIYALDPARFLLDNNDFIKLNDAQYIEVIHTSARIIGAGIREKIGNSDFYPNYGKIQPHCQKVLNMITCDHIASVLYLAESINSNIGFYGTECEKIQKLIYKVECECINDDCFLNSANIE